MSIETMQSEQYDKLFSGAWPRSDLRFESLFE